jgi:hypothetical protein
VREADREVRITAMLYSAGPCSVCGVAGDALFAKDAQSGKLFFFCPSCGVAWPRPPEPYRVDSIDPVESLAPAGIVMPTRDEIRAASLEHLIQAEVADGSWDIQDWLARSPGMEGKNLPD